jgi:hypothetical protein
MTLIFPLPGPWLPTGVALATGAIMGGLGRIVCVKELRGVPKTSRGAFFVLGLVSGAYLGWISARGAPAELSGFVAPSEGEQLLSAVVCGGLGLAANGGIVWLMGRAGDRPLRVLYLLLCLLLLFLAAVSLLVIRYEAAL